MTSVEGEHRLTAVEEGMGVKDDVGAEEEYPSTSNDHIGRLTVRNEQPNDASELRAARIESALNRSPLPLAEKKADSRRRRAKRQRGKEPCHQSPTCSEGAGVPTRWRRSGQHVRRRSSAPNSRSFSHLEREEGQPSKEEDGDEHRLEDDLFIRERSEGVRLPNRTSSAMRKLTVELK